jgi:DNA polymerase III delta prime subunit
MGLVSKQYDDFVWELKYRPNTLDDIILPDRLSNHFQKIKKLGKLPNLLFSGSAGTGKTTTALVLADDMDLSAMYMNMSIDTSIDDIRGRMMAFASSMSLEGKQKVFIGDEFDRLSASAMDSLKGVIENMSKNCKFIFTSNNKGKLIEPIISRLQDVDFIFSKDEAGAMKKQMWKTACQICHKEDAIFDKAAVAVVVKDLFPDMRKILNRLQMLSLQGDISVQAVENFVATDTDAYFQYLRDRDWPGCRQFIVDLPIAYNDFYSVIYQNIERYIDPEQVSEAIVMVAKYQYEAAFALDKEIPLAALCIEMMQLDFKKDF